ncbi:MAG: alpha/beta fold hydrolase [Deltaproteobacteria bacterium]|nr:MAG: alpha/beta fold hydrolase [Deltaproteobacteria bacterium]
MTALPEGQYAHTRDGHRMHFHSIGEGQPVLWLHGSGPGASGWSNFRANAEALAAHGYESILVDSIGYGLSDKPTDVPYGLGFMASCAADVMASLGHETYAVVGNSQGGAQAIRIALDHPERVSKLVLMAPGGLETRETYMECKGIRSMVRCIYGPEGITVEGMRKVFTKQVYDSSEVPEGVIERRTEIALTQPIHVFRTMQVDNQEDRLHEIGCPTLGLWGMDDVFCPPSGAEKLATRIPDCRVTLFNKCGHWVMVERAAVFDRLVADFLNHG